MAHIAQAAQDERYVVLEKMLRSRREEIQEKLRALRDARPDQAPAVQDSDEQSVNDFIQEVDLALMQMASETLREIDEALRRLDAGTYGLCVDCSGEIPAARLSALPFADRCRACQEQHEAATDAPRSGGLPGSRLREALAFSSDREA